jgi:hypothetical protein
MIQNQIFLTLWVLVFSQKNLAVKNNRTKDIPPEMRPLHRKTRIEGNALRQKNGRMKDTGFLRHQPLIRNGHKRIAVLYA